MNRPPAPPPGWYPDPTGAPRQRYWSGTEWGPLGAAAPQKPPPPKKVLSAERIIFLPLTIAIGALAALFAIAGKWEALGGVLVLGVMVAAPIYLLLLIVRRTNQTRRMRSEQREYREGLIARADQQHRSFMAGDVDEGAFGAYQPSREGPYPNDLPDAEQMRQQAWQPDIDNASMPAVRPTNPAPWHIVTQFPTRQFSSQHKDPDPGEQKTTT